MTTEQIRLKYPWLAEPDITDSELQDAVNEAEFCLLLQSSILYGLMTGDPNSINQEKCISMIEHGKRKGIEPVKGFIPKWFRLGAVGQTGT